MISFNKLPITDLDESFYTDSGNIAIQLNVTIKEIKRDMKSAKPSSCIPIVIKGSSSTSFSLAEVLSALKPHGYDLTSTVIQCSSQDRSFNCFSHFEEAEGCLIPNDACSGNLMLSYKSLLHKQQHKLAKERTIREVVQIVAYWRGLYAGVVMPDCLTRKYTLNQAAVEMNISKKTLDDYLLQIKIGKQYGFEFNKYSNEKIGILRSFVQLHKSKKK